MTGDLDRAAPGANGDPADGASDGEGAVRTHAHDPRIRVILNPNAGSKAGIPTNTRDAEARLRELMAGHGLGDDLVVSASEEEAIAATRDAIARGFGAIAAAGGDGTIGAIARELLHTGTALGILPLGSVMNIARMLDLPRDLAEAARAIATARDAGTVRIIDVGRATSMIRTLPATRRSSSRPPRSG